MGIKRFEDIEAWQHARKLCQAVYQLTSDDKFHRDYALREQARKAATSVMANIAEGFDSRSNTEFIQFLYYALRSASELQSHFYVAMDQEYLSKSQFDQVYRSTGRVKGMIFKFIEYLRKHEKRRTPHPPPRTSDLEPRTDNP